MLLLGAASKAAGCGGGSGMGGQVDCWGPAGAPGRGRASLGRECPALRMAGQMLFLSSRSRLGG